jgi:nucleotide-binding universal stress UspA family protein
MTEFNIKQALICIDLSDTDNVIFDYLNYVQLKLGIDHMFFLHVVKRPTFLSGWFGKNYAAIHSEFVLNEDIEQQIIDNIASKLLNYENIVTECKVQEGNPLDIIIEVSKEQHADLLVFGKKVSSESSGILGKRLARQSNASLLMIPSGTVNKLDNIFVPVDFSENSGKALQKAIQINYQLDSPAKISCVHVYEMPDLSYYKINRTYEQLKEIIEADMQEAFDRFVEKYAPNMGDMLIKKSELRGELSTAGELISLCDEYHANLVIMGAKGHTAFNSLFIGSVAEKFLHLNVNIPTLIIR